jgi:malonyl-CoA O-methyltransferase
MSAERENLQSVESVSTQTGYDRWSVIYDADENPLVTIEEPVMRQLIGDVTGKRVLDVGCGTGRHTAALAAAGARVSAIDFSQGMLQQAKLKPECGHVDFVQHDLAEPFPFAEGSFDAIVCGLVLDHIRKLDLLFGEMHRVCKPGSFAAVSVMHPAMSLIGVQARFTDPHTGNKVQCGSQENTTSDYINAITRAGWGIETMIERSVDTQLIQLRPRAEKYAGWPMLMAWHLAR